jgi:NDP-sugar pyrophosphorylase family protein
MNQIQVVIPMAGLGSRFTQEGYTTPKPLLPIGNLKMIEVVLQNLTSDDVEKVVIVTKTVISEASSLPKLLAEYSFDVEIVLIDETTNGPATTCVLAKHHLDMNKPLVIANSDQYLDTDMKSEYQKWDELTMDGIIWAMEDDSPKWSYVRANRNGFAVEVKEKVVISNLATCGVYAYSKAEYFFQAYEAMVSADDCTNNEFYVAPTYNYLVRNGKKIYVRDLGKAGTVMHGLGIPEDYEAFLSSGIPERLTQDS